MFGGDENKGNLGMVVLEYDVVASGGKKIAEGCYILEEDYCVILCAEYVRARIERNIAEDEGTAMVKVKYEA